MLVQQVFPRSVRYNERVRTFRRRLFASVSVLSLILCLATVGLWVRSYWYGDWWGWMA